MRLLLVTSTEPHPDYLQYPVDTPLPDWDHPDIVEISVGVHRHVVRFLERDGACTR